MVVNTKTYCRPQSSRQSGGHNTGGDPSRKSDRTGHTQQLRDGYGEDVHSQDQITNTGPFPLDCDTKFAFVLRGRLPNDVTDCDWWCATGCPHSLGEPADTDTGEVVE